MLLAKHLHDVVCIDLFFMKEAGLGAIQGEPVTCTPLGLKHISHLPLALDDLSAALLLLGDEGQVHIQATCGSNCLEHVAYLPVLGFQAGQALKSCFCVPAVHAILQYTTSPCLCPGLCLMQMQMLHLMSMTP